MFLPLKTEYFRAFESGAKTTEYRVYNKRFNERTCYIGRAVVLSLGYGARHRLQGRIVRFHTSVVPTQTAEWQDCYGNAPGIAAGIGIELDYYCPVRRRIAAEAELRAQFCYYFLLFWAIIPVIESSRLLTSVNIVEG
jgi:hypothetical protein